MKTNYILITVTEFEENIRPIKAGDIVYTQPSKRAHQKGYTVIESMEDRLSLKDWKFRHYPTKTSLYIPVSIVYSEYKPKSNKANERTL